MKNAKLYYNTPAAEWMDSIPIGNGKLGAMVFGGVATERLQLNEETLWSGFFDKIADNPDCKKYLGKMRELLFAGKTAECEELASKYLVCGAYGTKYHPDRPWAYGTYQTAGDIFVEFEGCEEFSDYSRSLDMMRGVVSVNYTSAGKRFARRIFSAIDDNVIAMKTEADGKFSAKVRYDREDVVFEEQSDGILVRGQFETILWALSLKVVTDGTVSVLDREVFVKDATYFDLYVSVASDYLGLVKNPTEAVLSAVENSAKKGFAALEKEAAGKFLAVMDRAAIDLGGEEWNIPFNEKVVKVRAGEVSEARLHSVMETLWQYARYLSVSSSYKCALPANLQGIWAPDYHPFWSADYHININIQMNYWLTELTSLPECADVFVKFIKFFSENGKNTARDQYGCRGWVAHTFSTPWAFTSPGNRYQTGSFMCGGAWCCGHIWERWLFSRDIEFLREYYPVLRGAAEFFLDFLVTDPNTGYLVTAPSHSPENAYYDPKTRAETVLCVGPTADNAIIYELLTNTAEAASVLGIDEDFRKEILAVRAKLSPYKLGKYGQIMEWQEDFDEVEIGHRHLSHLYGVHPGAQITKTKEPALVEAAKASVNRRVENGGGACGFSRVWLVSMCARLGMPEDSYNHLKVFLEKQVYNNAFNCDVAFWHPYPFYQIDGNFGLCAGISEMLLQSHDGFIEILPALPSKWKNGSFRGLCARGGFTVSAEWKNGTLASATIESKSGEPCEVRYAGKTITLKLAAGAKETISF